MDPDERRKRHELSYGVYNFRDVKLHFSRLGWTFRPGPSLSYDHYYIKPGKNPRNPQHKQGVDYFLGEAELVAYARRMNIFGEDTAPVQPLATNGRGRGKRRARSSSSARTNQATVDVNSGDSDSDAFHISRRNHKRHRRRSAGHKAGHSAQNPIALSSDSSDGENDTGNSGGDVDISSVEEDEEWIEGDARGGFDEEEDEEEETEISEGSPSSSSAEEVTNDEPEEEDLVVATSSKKAVKPPRGKSQSYAETREVKRKENSKTEDKAKSKTEDKANTKDKDKAQVSAGAKAEAKSEETSTDGDAGRIGKSHKSPRPLLSTSHRKRAKVTQTTTRQLKNDSKNDSGSAAKGVRSPSKRKPLAVRIGKVNSVPRSLLKKAQSSRYRRWEDTDEMSFDLGVAEYGESPPRRPPSRVHSRANSVRSGQSSPLTSVMAAIPPQDSPEEQKEEAPPACFSPETRSRSPPAAVSATSHSFLFPSANVSPMSTPISPNKVVDTGTSGQVSMELTQVVLPPDRDNKYHIRVTVSGSKPPVHTIWMENLSSHEQREYSFTDVLDLPGAKTDTHVPTVTVLTALFRCLSSQPDAVVLLGPEPRATAESKTAFEKGEVQLRTSTAEKNSGDFDRGGDSLTLVVTYPALDLFWVDHNFPMKLVSAGQRVQHLAKEVERLKEQLALVQTDRDKLCEQLQQQEEENERTLSQQVEEQVRARLAAQSARPQEQQNSEEMERRVAKLVEKETQTLKQAQEKETRDRDHARRWFFARSYWMSAFQPCRTLIAGAITDTETSLVRPGTATNARTYTVEWKEVVEFADPFFQTAAEPQGGAARSITVTKDGVYQVNLNVSHDSLFQLRLVVTPPSKAARRPQEIEPTKVLLYDNKRRVSRVDMVLELRALDQLSLQLQLQDTTAPPLTQEEWLRTPMPTHNRFLIVVLDEHAVHP